MPLNEEVLKFIKNQGKVRKSDLTKQFGLAASSALADLRNEQLVTTSKDPVDLFGSDRNQGYVYRVSPNGLKHLSDFEEQATKEKTKVAWERWVAVISILLSLAALLISCISLRQANLGLEQSTTSAVSSSPAPQATSHPSP